MRKLNEQRLDVFHYRSKVARTVIQDIDNDQVDDVADALDADTPHVLEDGKRHRSRVGRDRRNDAVQRCRLAVHSTLPAQGLEELVRGAADDRARHAVDVRRNAAHECRAALIGTVGTAPRKRQGDPCQVPNARPLVKTGVEPDTNAAGPAVQRQPKRLQQVLLPPRQTLTDSGRDRGTVHARPERGLPAAPDARPSAQRLERRKVL